MVQLPNAGTYTGRLNGRVVLAKAQSGALCAYVPVALVNSDIAWHGKHTVTLVKKDGEVQGRSLQTMKEVFGWDGQLESWESVFGSDTEAGSIPEELTFELVCIHEEFTPQPSENNPEPQPVMAFKVQYLNALGGGSRMPEPIDKKTLIAEFGNKFRAMSGGKPAAKPAAASKTATATKPAAAQAPAKAPPSKGGPPAAKAKTAGGQQPTATMEEAWQSCLKASNGDEEAAGTAYWAKMAELFGDEANNDTLTIQQFGQLKVAFESAS